MILTKKQKLSSDPKSTKKLHPLLLFIGAYCTYNILGLLNMPWSLQGAYSKDLPWSLFIIGLAGCVTGYILFGRKKAPLKYAKLRSSKSKTLGAFFLLIFISCIAFTIITNKGIPLLLGEARFTNSAIIFNLAPLFGFWIMFRYISDLNIKKKPKKAPVIFYCAGIIIFGYRAPALIALLTIYFYYTTFEFDKNKTIKHAAITATAFITLSAIFSGYRISQEYELSDFFKNVDFQYVNEHKYVAPLVPVLSMFDFSQQTISSIGTNLKSHMYGALFLSNYEALLPGSHWGARNIVGDLTDARWVNNRPMSITPTLQGALYIDFSYAGVFFGFFIIATAICLIKSYATNGSALFKFSFCYLFTLSLLSIHSGYWDISILFYCLFLAIIKIYDLLKKTFPKQLSFA
ncbi:hypothetical protein D3C76_308240 [compost metagenome]|uniref:oligosaccharide repeat unit polymerase n=1 Tax=Pseudomonas TaxID=286 RepID=UPI000FA9DE52|nr:MULTISPECIES: oligosaccharide repeat unit polymerase [Pseudomonas]